MTHDTSILLTALQDAPPSPEAKRQHMARYLRDNAYYTMRDMDITSFSKLYKFGHDDELWNHQIDNIALINDKPSIEATKVCERPNTRRRRRRPSENAMALHQMTARISLLKRQSKARLHSQDGMQPETITNVGIFARQKQADCMLHKKINHSSPIEIKSESSKQEENMFDVQTMSVDSIDNVLSSNTRYPHSSLIHLVN